MGDQVTVKVDSRMFYGLIALVAVVGIFAVGLWLGGQFGGTSATTANPAPANPGAVVAAPTPGVVIGGDNNAIVNELPAEASQKPVAPEAVAVEEGQPRIWIPEVAETNFQYDFGSIPADNKIEKDFEVANVGKGTLIISDASASCGCTAALVADSELEPGDKTTIRVSYDPRVNQEFGKFVTKQIRIKSNDPVVPLAEFTITADVQSQ